MIALGFALTVAGLAALALAMDRHAEHAPRAWAGQGCGGILRVLGGLALGGALAVLQGATDPCQALLLWIGLLAPGTLAVASGMALADRIRRRRQARRSASSVE